MGHLEQRIASLQHRTRPKTRVEVCSDNKCGGCLECLLSQNSRVADREIKLRVTLAKELDAIRHIQRAAEDFVVNVDNSLVEGGGEMPLKADASFRELRAALNKHRRCEECGEATNLERSKMILGRITCNECERNSYALEDLAIGREWRKNSSLEKWFPFSAERLAKLEAEKAEELKTEMTKKVAKLEAR